MTSLSERPRRAELAAFLRATRARLGPIEAGLSTLEVTTRRRTPGLRREEVAQLSGVSVTWYTWLEQGRDINPSAQVIDALARTLRLCPDQHRHLRRLAGLSIPDQPGAIDNVVPQLQRLIDAASPSLACVYDRHFDYVAWNDSYALMRHDPARLTPERRNLLWVMFGQGDPVSYDLAVHQVLGQFRAAAAERPADPRFAQIVTELTALSPRFRRLWASYPVPESQPEPASVAHPVAGPVDVQVFTLRPSEAPDLLVVIQVPTEHRGVEVIARLLA